MKSEKLFAVEAAETEPGIFTYSVRIPLQAGMKFNPDKHFQWHEASDYLGDALMGVPYATYSTKSMPAMEDMLENGYTHGDDRRWRAFFGYWKDTEGHAYMVPADSNIKSLEDVGLYTFMKTPADFMKVGKYVNRTIAGLVKSAPTVDLDTGEVDVPGLSVWGDEVSFNPTENQALVVIDQEPGKDLSEEDRTLSVLYVDLDDLSPLQKAIGDGMVPLSKKAVRLLGLSRDPAIGMAWRCTVVTPRGLGKGHFPYVPGLEADIVIYGPKTVVKSKRFFFGSMGPLHVGVPHTDMQAYINFGYHRKGLAVDLAVLFMKEIIRASRNEEEIRRLLLRHTKNMKPWDMNQDAWVLRIALRYGLSFLRFPGLYRRVVRYLTTKVMNTHEKARIPMESVSYSIAKSAYVLGDINAINPHGDIIVDHAIPEGCIVFPDLPAGTKVICYRQPSENSNAWKELTVIDRPEYHALKGRGICILGQGALTVLGRLGGGDMDDSFVIVHDPVWVEAFRTLRPYPETEKMSAETVIPTVEETEAQSRLSELEEELLGKVKAGDYLHYTIDHVYWQIELARGQRSGIGPAVNVGMDDLLKSDPDHKASMLTDLVKRADFWTWLNERLPYQMALYMTNLELIIDGNVKNRDLLAKLGDIGGTIYNYHKAQRVYPESLRNRIPQWKLGKWLKDPKEYVFARSLTCRSLTDISEWHTALEEEMTKFEWRLARPASKDLDFAYSKKGPRYQVLRAKVRGTAQRDETSPTGWTATHKHPSLIDIWTQEWNKVFSIPNNPELLENKAYNRILGLISKEVEGFNDYEMEAMAVELYRMSYTRTYAEGKKDLKTGKLRNYQDALLWSPLFANHFIKALRNATTPDERPIAGYYSTAEIRPEFRKRLVDIPLSPDELDTTHVLVEVRDTLIFIQDSNDAFTVLVGWVVGPSVNGRYRMDGGVIEFRAGQDMLQPPTEGQRIAQKSLVRVYPSAKGQDTPPPKKEVETTSAWKAMWSKAKQILNIKEGD